MTALTHKENDLHNRLIVAEFNLGQVEEELRRLHEENKALRTRLAQPEPEPVAWLITDENINSLQVNSIQRLIDRAKRAHMTDIKLRINGQDEWYQADWLKHLKRTAPPQREWQGLTDEEIDDMMPYAHNEFDILENHDFARAIEAKLKEKNEKL